ncbi:GNAT family N-acetyltransferase [Streptomyces virginiae]|uniref:GNAT family N-acetyltransferase n=1 Tax=Streptomyces virginiae TaxID=1961 RepID=UPI0036F0D4E5
MTMKLAAVGSPLPPATITEWQRDERAPVLVEDERAVGYGELWFDAEEDEVELARIIVAPDARGKGLGRALVRGLLAQAAAAGHHDIFLRVHPDNGPASRCYRAAGFAPVDPALAATWNKTQPVAYLRLRHDGEASGA